MRLRTRGCHVKKDVESGGEERVFGENRSVPHRSGAGVNVNTRNGHTSEATLCPILRATVVETDSPRAWEPTSL